MAKWFNSQPPAPPRAATRAPVRLPIPEGRDIDVRVGIEVARTPVEVWALLRPAEKAWLIDPKVDRCFKAPGTPDGVGEIQICIDVPHAVTGQRRVTAVEVTVEVPEQFAKTRSLTEVGVLAETEYRLSESAVGTFLEVRIMKDYTPTAGTTRSDSTRTYIDKEASRCRQQWEDYLLRVKTVLEAGAVADDASSAQPAAN